jgi:hypothetical protein
MARHALLKNLRAALCVTRPERKTAREQQREGGGTHNGAHYD